MKSKTCVFVFIVYCIVWYTQTGISRPKTLENGYTLPEATKENVDKVVQTALDNLVFVEGGSYLMGDSGYLYKKGKGFTGLPGKRTFRRIK